MLSQVGTILRRETGALLLVEHFQECGDHRDWLHRFRVPCIVVPSLGESERSRLLVESYMPTERRRRAVADLGQRMPT